MRAGEPVKAAHSIHLECLLTGAFPVAQAVERPPVMWGTQEMRI